MKGEGGGGGGRESVGWEGWGEGKVEGVAPRGGERVGSGRDGARRRGGVGRV